MTDTIIPRPKRRGGNVKDSAPHGYYTAAEATAYLSITRARLRELVTEGRLQTLTEPGKSNSFYESASVDALIAEQEQFALELLRNSHYPQHATYRCARMTDIPGIYRVLVSMGWPSTPIAQRQAWFRKNPHIYYLVKYKALVIGYVSMFPHPPDIIEEQLAGRMRGWHLWPRHILSFEADHTYDCYIGIAVRQDIPARMYRYYSGALIKHFFTGYLPELALHEHIYIRRLYGMSAEKDGQRLAQRLHFEMLPNKPDDVQLEHGRVGKRYVLDLETAQTKWAKTYRESVARAKDFPKSTTPPHTPASAAHALADLEARVREGRISQEELVQHLQDLYRYIQINTSDN